MRFFIVLLLILFSHLASATSFRRLSLDQMIEESTAAAEVKLVHKRSFMNEIGMIFTEHSFQVIEGFNLDKSDLDGEVLKLTLTGGSVNGVTSYIDGAPEFYPGERSFLLLKKIDQRFYISNFTLGKYKVIEESGKTFFVSSVFPSDLEMGKVSKEKMLEMIREKFRISQIAPKERPSLKTAISPNKFPAQKEYRAPAQVAEGKSEYRHKLILLTVITFITFIVSSVIGYKVLTRKEGL